MFSEFRSAVRLNFLSVSARDFVARSVSKTEKGVYIQKKTLHCSDAGKHHRGAIRNYFQIAAYAVKLHGC